MRFAIVTEAAVKLPAVPCSTISSRIPSTFEYERYRREIRRQGDADYHVLYDRARSGGSSFFLSVRAGHEYEDDERPVYDVARPTVRARHPRYEQQTVGEVRGNAAAPRAAAKAMPQTSGMPSISVAIANAA